MAYVMTTASTVECNHSGKPMLTSSAKLKVKKNPVLIQSSIGTSFTGCTNTDTSSGQKQCVSATLTASPASKLTVGGKDAVLLEPKGSAGTTDSTPPGTVTFTAGQEKLTAS